MSSLYGSGKAFACFGELRQNTIVSSFAKAMEDILRFMLNGRAIRTPDLIRGKDGAGFIRIYEPNSWAAADAPVAPASRRTGRAFGRFQVSWARGASLKRILMEILHCYGTFVKPGSRTEF